MGNVSFVKTQDGAAASGSGQVKLAHTIPETVLTSGLSRSMIYLAIKSRALRARKCGARTLILDSDLRKFLRKLPALVAGQPPPQIQGPQGRQGESKSAVPKRGNALRQQAGEQSSPAPPRLLVGPGRSKERADPRPPARPKAANQHALHTE
jgi:hypothetical protein